jgi:hypothetical protein
MGGLDTTHTRVQAHAHALLGPNHPHTHTQNMLLSAPTSHPTLLGSEVEAANKHVYTAQQSTCTPALLLEEPIMISNTNASNS